MYHKTMAIIVLCMQLCSSCTTGTDKLEQIEKILNENPSGALEHLERLPLSTITSSKSKAQYSLLKSIALDKIGIDIQNDSIISDAIAYYSRRGDPLNRCRTFYYAGRIYENKEDNEKAMEYITKTESLLHLINDSYLKSLIYATKGRLYFESLEYRKAASNFHTAAEYCSESSETNRWAANKTREGICLLQEKDYNAVEEIINSLNDHINDMTISTLNKYYQLRISLNIDTYVTGNIELTSEYIRSVAKDEIIDWLLLARACILEENPAGALEYLHQNQKYHTKDASYYYFLAQAYELDGRKDDAIESYKEYIYLSGDIGQVILSKDTKFVEEREMHQERYAQEKNRRFTLTLIIIVIFMALAVASLLIVTIRKQLKIESLQRENLQNQLDELMLEREELAALEQKNREGRKIISERLRIIDQFVMSDAFSDSIFESKASETLKTIISDRAEFVRQNRLIFNQSSSEFIHHLKEKGLTDREIDHCCLYAIGMNGKMVTTFTNAKRHYHIGSDVRKKLGLNTHDTNISIYNRNLYHQMQSL